MTIDYVATISIFVANQERAKEFYTQKLGLELRADNPLYPGAEIRWIAVAPKGARTELILYLPDENWDHYKNVVGKSQPITLNVTDINSYAEILKEKGVILAHEPEVQPWGTYAVIQDSEGNNIIIVEQPKENENHSSNEID